MDNFYSTLTTRHLAEVIAVLERVASDKDQDFELRCDAAKAASSLRIHGMGHRVAVKQEA